jgi:hypothetical protein
MMEIGFPSQFSTVHKDKGFISTLHPDLTEVREILQGLQR